MNRRTLIHGLATAALPLPAYAGAAVPQPLATHLVVATPGHW